MEQIVDRAKQAVGGVQEEEDTVRLLREWLCDLFAMYYFFLHPSFWEKEGDGGEAMWHSM